ncbi:MAG: hypothetical protein GX387_10240 [Clostridium sp.]|nr:hypothetical protein [Clostridium sp.]
MLNINEFLEYNLFNEIERNDIYWENFENSFNEISESTDLKHQFIESFIEKSKFFNKDNIGRYRIILEEFIIERSILAEELYPVILNFMYHEFCYNPSIPHKFVKLMLRLKNKTIVFKDILENTSKYKPFKTGISICALYGLQDGFKDISIELVENFLDTVFECLQENLQDEKLKSVIENFLMEKIQNDVYNSYYIKFRCLLGI